MIIQDNVSYLKILNSIPSSKSLLSCMAEHSEIPDRSDAGMLEGWFSVHSRGPVEELL